LGMTLQNSPSPACSEKRCTWARLHGRRPRGRACPWIVITDANGGTTALSRGYRVPVLWIMKVQ
jgi:hypothetical protein